MSKRNSNGCFVPGCKSGYKSTKKKNKSLGKKNPTLFSVKNEEELEKWSKAVERTDKKMKIGDKVCELHFNEDNVLRYFETLLSDGTVWRIKRLKCGLKPGSVPTIFPNSKNTSIIGVPQNNVKISPEKRKILNNTYSCSKKRKIHNKNLDCQKSTLNKDSEHSVMTVNDKGSTNEQIFDENKIPEHSIITTKNNVPESSAILESENPEHPDMAISANVSGNVGAVKIKISEYPTMTLNDNGLENVEIIEKENSELAEIISNETTETFTYNTLINNLKLISRPDWSWGISAHDEFIMCAKWNKNTLMKRVVIDCNLKIRVFLKNRAIDFHNVKIGSIRDLSSILLEVNTYRMCVNVNNREKTKCDGYILPKMRSIQCEYCRLIGDWEVNKKQNTYWLSKGRNFAKHQMLYEKIEILNKKNALLKEQLSKIIKIKAVWKLSNQTNQNPVED